MVSVLPSGYTNVSVPTGLSCAVTLSSKVPTNAPRLRGSAHGPRVLVGVVVGDGIGAAELEQVRSGGRPRAGEADRGQQAQRQGDPTERDGNGHENPPLVCGTMKSHPPRRADRAPG